MSTPHGGLTSSRSLSICDSAMGTRGMHRFEDFASQLNEGGESHALRCRPVIGPVLPVGERVRLHIIRDPPRCGIHIQ